MRGESSETRKVHVDDRDIGTPAYWNLIKAKTVKKLLILVFRSLLRVDDGVATTRDFLEAVAIENPDSAAHGFD